MNVAKVIIAVLLLLPPAALQAGSRANDYRVELPNGERHILTSPAALQSLATNLDQLIRAEEQFLAVRKAARKELRQQTPLAEMPHAALKNYFAEPLELPTNNELRGLRALQTELAELQESTDAQARTNSMRRMMEIARSMENLRRAPLPARVEVPLIPFIFLGYLNRPVGKGSSPAANLPPLDGEADLSRFDPPDSSFWSKPGNITQKDLFHCLTRNDWPNFEYLMWEYDEPKTSFGSNPGFKVKHGDVEVKVKFAELHSEPFAVRIFDALGYNVEQTDYVRSLRIKYDRRLFRELHLRKELDLKFRFLGVVPAGHVRLQKRYDPFELMTGAVLKNGTSVDRDELRQRLLRDPDAEHPEDNPVNFDPSFEEQLDYLVTDEATVQLRDEKTYSLGPWEFGGLRHERLRELRGAGLLAAWLGWSDARFDNTRLKVVESGAASELRHYFSDLGGGLGKGGGMFSWHSDEPNLFAWTFTKPLRRQGKGRMTIPFRIVNYRPIDRVPAFKEMTLDDARWMARMIAQLTEEQMVQALVASGWDSAEVRLLTEKLINRRDRMIVDLELAGEIPLLRPAGVNRDFSYDPAKEGPIAITLQNGTIFSAPVSDQRVVAGRIERRSEER